MLTRSDAGRPSESDPWRGRVPGSTSVPAAFWLCLLWLAALPASLAGQNPVASLYNRLELNLSVTDVILNADIRVDASSGDRGTEVDAEDDLGLSTTKIQPRASLRWRPGRRHELELGYQFARRTASNTLSRTIEFGDSTFEAGLQLDNELNTDQLFLTYRFSIVANDRMRFGVGLGLGALFLESGLEVVAGTVNDNRSFSQARSFTGPIGAVGLFGQFLAGDRWYFEADARYVQISISRFSARVGEAGGAVRYFVSRRVGLEAGYGLSAVRIDVDPKTEEDGTTSGFAGRVRYSLQNVRLGTVIVL